MEAFTCYVNLQIFTWNPNTDMIQHTLPVSDKHEHCCQLHSETVKERRMSAQSTHALFNPLHIKKTFFSFVIFFYVKLYDLQCYPIDCN